MVSSAAPFWQQNSGRIKVGFLLMGLFSFAAIALLLVFPAKQASAALPTFVNCSASAVSGIGAITPTLPANIATNDILLLFLETANEAITIPTPNGGTWTEIPTDSPQGTGTAGGTTATRLTMFWSRFNGSQGNPTTSDSGDHQLGTICAFRGAEISGNPWDVTSGNIDATSDTSLSATGDTTTVADTFIIVAATLMDDAQNFGATWTNADLASITVQQNVTTTSGNDARLGVVTGTKASIGAYAATTNTITANSVKGMMTVALKPVNVPYYRSSAYIISQTVDTNAVNGAGYHSLLWKGTKPTNTNVKIQLATSNCANGATNAPTCNVGAWGATGSDYYADNGTTCATTNYYTPAANSAQKLTKCNNTFNNKRYFRYKIILEATPMGDAIPTVDDVIILWAS